MAQRTSILGTLLFVLASVLSPQKALAQQPTGDSKVKPYEQDVKLSIPQVAPRPMLTMGGGPSLRLNEVLQQSQSYFPSVTAVRQDRLAADADLLSSQGAFDIGWRTRAATTAFGYYRNYTIDSILEQPTPFWGTTVFAGWRIGRGDFAVYDGKKETNEWGEVRVGINVPLWRNGWIDRRRANIQRAELGQKIAQLGVSQQLLETSRAASVTYWQWVVAGKRLKIAKTLLDVAIERDKALEKRVERGDLPALERADNARAILQRQAQVVSAERAWQKASFDLSLYYRPSGKNAQMPDASALPDDLPEPTAQPANENEEIELALSQRPEAKRISIQREQTSIELDWAKNQTRPTIDFQFMVSKDLGDGPSYRRPADVEAGVFLEVPLQTRVADGRASSALANMAKLSAQEQLATERITNEVKDARSELNATLERIKLARQELELATQIEALERKRFELGDSTILILNLREQAKADAAIREAEALGDYQRALAVYQAVLGSLK